MSDPVQQSLTVMLDTEPLRRDPGRVGAAFRALSQLVRGGHVRLYISEGTFNRTRRAAIRSLARALSEMEVAAS